MKQTKLSDEERWSKLAQWLQESIESVERGDLSRLSDEFKGEQGEAAVTAYRTVQKAMKILEHWEVMGLPKKADMSD